MPPARPGQGAPFVIRSRGNPYHRPRRPATQDRAPNGRNPWRYARSLPRSGHSLAGGTARRARDDRARELRGAHAWPASASASAGPPSLAGAAVPALRRRRRDGGADRAGRRPRRGRLLLVRARGPLAPTQAAGVGQAVAGTGARAPCGGRAPGAGGRFALATRAGRAPALAAAVARLPAGAAPGAGAGPGDGRLRRRHRARTLSRSRGTALDPFPRERAGPPSPERDGLAVPGLRSRGPAGDGAGAGPRHP